MSDSGDTGDQEQPRGHPVCAPAASQTTFIKPWEGGLKHPSPLARDCGTVAKHQRSKGRLGWGLLTHRGGSQTPRPGCARVLPALPSCHRARCRNPKSTKSSCSAATPSLLSLYSDCVVPKRGGGRGDLEESKGLVPLQRSAPRSLLSPELHKRSPDRAGGI